MNSGVFKDRGFRLLLLLLSAIAVLLITGFLLFTYKTLSDLGNEIRKNEITTVGKLLKKAPDMEKELPFIMGDSDERYFETGLRVMTAYGYSSDMGLEYNSSVLSAFKKLNISFILLLVGCLLAITISLIIHMNSLSKKLQEISLGADYIMNGRYRYRLPDEKEGDIAIVGSQFNQMAKRLELTLEELNQEKDNMKDFVSVMTHQLKTPLASLKTMNELLLNGAQEKPEVRREFLARSQEQIERMEWLIQTLLKITRLETGSVKFNRKKIELNSLLEEITDTLQPRLVAKKLTLEFDSGEEAYLLCDKDWLGQAIENIIKNAIDYTPVKGNIAIALTCSYNFTKISINDSGIGIDTEDLPHIFDRFYRGKNAPGTSRNGTGIGLSLSRAVIEKHNGLINVRSKKGKGSTFTIELPNS